MKTAPYTIFGKTKQVPIKVVQNNETIETDEWDEELWIEIGEDWYALESPQLKGKRVRIIERDTWLRCRE
jgi:hypothetical protein